MTVPAGLLRPTIKSPAAARKVATRSCVTSRSRAAYRFSTAENSSTRRLVNLARSQLSLGFNHSVVQHAAVAPPRSPYDA